MSCSPSRQQRCAACTCCCALLLLHGVLPTHAEQNRTEQKECLTHVRVCACSPRLPPPQPDSRKLQKLLDAAQPQINSLLGGEGHAT